MHCCYDFVTCTSYPMLHDCTSYLSLNMNSRTSAPDDVVCTMPFTCQSVTMPGPVLLRRRCPAVPRFDGPALLRDVRLNDHAEHMSIYFRPWTLCLADANDDVSHVANLCGSGSWRAAWKKWVHGCLVTGLHGTSPTFKQCILYASRMMELLTTMGDVTRNNSTGFQAVLTCTC